MTSLHATDREPSWKAPKGRTIEAVCRDATRQVIRNYGEALRKLATDRERAG